MVHALTGFSNSGFYVDVGAYHPQHKSNTHLLYTLGWSGINIEPTPSREKAFLDLRPRDITLNMGVSEKPSSIPFYLFDEPAFNTFSKEAMEVLSKRDYPTFLKEVAVPVRPLAQIFDEHLNGRTIDLMDVDVEGFEIEVLRSNNWEKYRPKLILLENGSPILIAIEREAPKYLLDLGYELLGGSCQNLIFRDTQNT